MHYPTFFFNMYIVEEIILHIDKKSITLSTVPRLGLAKAFSILQLKFFSNSGSPSIYVFSSKKVFFAEQSSNHCRVTMNLHRDKQHNNFTVRNGDDITR